ncbi:MAG: ABC transporter ATP-binding protein [Tissierellia bacterium]|nr:ABC transporter ATP-binding protein [Tissierellia bacterium]
MENKPILEIKNLVVEYRTDDGIVQALNGLDLSIQPGETHGLVGETGAGKTTAGLGILKLIPDPPGVVVDGEIYLDGKNVMVASDKEMESMRGYDVSMIFQDPMTSLNPVMTVEDQIAEVYELHEDISQADSLKKTHEILELVGIPAERGNEYPHQFSGGMKQRVVIAMALAGNPKLLIADEPTTALDVTIQAQVLGMMKDLKDKYNTAMLMITHDLGIVAEVCDKVSVIYAGRIVEQGNLVDIFDNTRHPYTEGLFNSLPNLADRTQKLKPIKGLMPDPSNLPTGCPFHPRCDYVMEICSKVKPPRVYRDGAHYVECHLYNEENIKKGGVIERD